MKVFNKFFGVTAKIYMKSGNVITLKHIQDLQIKYSDDITYLKITKTPFWRFFKHEELLIGSIKLSQIEAITSN